MHGYQKRAIDHVHDHPEAMLWLGMGLGKTTIILHAFAQLQDELRTGPLLVVAPLRVAQTVWRQEARKWEDTARLRFRLIHGRPDQRLRELLSPADVYLVNYEGARWMVEQIQQYRLKKGLYPPFSMMVFDEISRLKHYRTKVNAAVRRLLPYTQRRVGLTGTPASNGYADLFGQYLVVDQGKRLGQSITAYRQTFMRFEGYGHFGKYLIRDGMEKQIHACIADITLEMSSEEYLELPEVVVNDIVLELTGNLRGQYEQLERELFVELDSQVVLEVASVLACSMKCRQFANGAAYVNPGDSEWEEIHDLKLDALDEIIEEANGRPVLVAYEFKHDAERIAKRWPDARFINSKLSAAESEKIMDDWNANKIPLLCGHPLSMGHGLNLQYGECTDIALMGLSWQPDFMEQVVGRLMRQGQRNNIRVHRLLMRKTVDQLMALSLKEKQLTEEGLKSAVREYRKQKNLG